MKVITKLFFLLIIIVNFIQAQESAMGIDFEKNLIYVEDSQAFSIDPLTNNHNVAARVTELLFASLFKPDQFGGLVPELAEDLPVLDVSGRIATVTLKENLKWSNGSKLTSEDVNFTILAALNEESDTFNRDIYSFIKKVTVIDKRKIQFEFIKPIPDQPEKYLNFFIIPKDRFMQPIIKKELSYCQSPDVTSGGMKIKSKLESGQKIFFESNPNYCVTNKPQITEMTMTVYPDRNSHVDQLINSTVYLVPNVRMQDIPKIKNDPDFRLSEYSASEYEFFVFNCQDPILKIREVRQAMNFALNRQDLLSSYFNNDGDLMSGPLPPGHYGINPDVEPYPFNPEKAIQLLESVGIRDTDGDHIRELAGKPLKLTLLVPIILQDSNAKQLWQSFINQMNSIGIHLELERFAPEIYNLKLLNHDFQLASAGWQVRAQSDIYPFFISTQAHSGGKNLSNFVSDEVDQLLIRARYSNDFSEKTALLKSLHKILHDEAPFVYLWHLKHHAAFTRRLKNVFIDPNNFFSTIEDWYWEN